MKRWRMSLRAAIGVMALTAIVFGWWSNGMFKQRHLASQVRQLRGDVLYEWDFDGAPSAPLGPFSAYKALRERIGADAVDRIVALDLTDRVSVSDEHAIAILNKYSFRGLFLSNTQLSDRSMPAIGHQSECEIIRLVNTPISSGGVSQLCGMSKLRELDLSQTRITDAALRFLATCRQLQVLRLKDTAITDQGIAELRPLSELRQLDVIGTRVSIRAAEELRRSLPQCTIEVSDGDWIRTLPALQADL